MNEVFLEIGQDAIMTLAGLFFMALSAVGTLYVKRLISYLKEKQALTTVSRYVKWVEQAPAFQDFVGEQKFEVVFAKAMQWLEDNNIPVDEDALAIMIEEAVKNMKAAAEPLYTGE
jgi:hypothetical protein